MDHMYLLLRRQSANSKRNTGRLGSNLGQCIASPSILMLITASSFGQQEASAKNTSDPECPSPVRNLQLGCHMPSHDAHGCGGGYPLSGFRLRAASQVQG
jgi:hypothetical protein